MKSNKLIFATIIALLAVCVFASVANAQTTAPSFDMSVSSGNHGVNTASTYTITVTNTGATALTSVNITVPAGYSNVVNIATPTQSWTANYVGGIISLTTSGSGITNGQTVTVTFDATNPVTSGTYSWSAIAATQDGTTTTKAADFTTTVSSILPMIEVLIIAAVIAFVNSGINRALVGYFVGWEQYRVMQKEMAEYRKETMAAARANDQKRMEKLKKKQSQITAMQGKMMKPQFIQIGISFVYILIWFLVLIPVFGNTTLAYLPGIGPLPVAWLYPLFSFFLALLSQRIVGVNPIEQ